jgi:hypothetical protein
MEPISENSINALGENKEVYVPINCNNCLRKPACIFLERYNEMAKSNFMYGMFEYLEWNNLEKIFKENARHCKYYRTSFIGGRVSFDLVEGESIMQVLRLSFPDNMHSYGSTHPKDRFKLTLRSGEIIDAEFIESNITVTHKNPDVTANK